MRRRRCQIGFLASVLLGLASAVAQDVPTSELTCVKTTIARLEHRLKNGINGPFVPSTGSAVRFANGLYQVAYVELEAVRQSRNGVVSNS